MTHAVPHRSVQVRHDVDDPSGTPFRLADLARGILSAMRPSAATGDGTETERTRRALRDCRLRLEHAAPAVTEPPPGGEQREAGQWQGSVAGLAHRAETRGLREVWFQALEQEARARIARDMHVQALSDMPYIPTGRWSDLTACRSNLARVLKGMPLFCNLRKEG